jgi:hypothetical protein
MHTSFGASQARPVGQGVASFELKQSLKALTEPMSPPLATKARGAHKAAARAQAAENESHVGNL